MVRKVEVLGLQNSFIAWIFWQAPLGTMVTGSMTMLVGQDIDKSSGLA